MARHADRGRRKEPDRRGEEETEASEEIETERENADKEAAEEIQTGEKDAKKEKADKEAEAAAKKAEAKKESSGFFGWLASKAKAAFNAIKSAVSAIMKGLRDAVKGIINAAKKLAVAAIEAARKIAVAAIRVAGDAIIAFGDVALAAFPEAREKFRGYINEKVADAEDAVNELADDLKKSAEAFFDALGEFLDKAFQLLEKALLALIDVYAKAVDTIIKAAEAIAKAFGMFFMLIKDVASNPGGWISNLGAAVVDGIQNHLVKAMKDAISAWFNGKVEEVIGLPMDFMKALFSGGIDIGAIAKIAWSALKTAIPGILIQLLIEKLVAMVVPAAGAVMAIIEGLQAAWGTVSKILAAIDKFIAFLKAVKGGGAGPQFAQAVAAGAVAVIDFVANWLLLRLMKPAKKVSGKLAAMAKKIMAKLKKGLKKVGKKIKKAVKKIKKKAKGLLKKKGKGKKKDKAKRGDKNKDDKKRKDAENRKKLKRAMRAFKAGLGGGVPEAQAKSLASSSAGREQAQATLSPAGTRWRVQMSINPKIEKILKGTSSQKASDVCRKQNVTKKSLQALLTRLRDEASQDIRDEAPESAPVGKRDADKQANKQIKQDVKAAGGLESFVEQKKQDPKNGLVAPADPAKAGSDFERVAAKKEKARLEALGHTVDPTPKAGNASGADVGSSSKDGTARVTDIKDSSMRAVSQRSSRRPPTQPESQQIKLDPDPPKRPRENEGARHLRKNPGDADRLMEGDILTKKRGKKKIAFDVKVSAITTNIDASLEKLIAGLQKALQATPKKARKARKQIQSQIKATQAIRANESGKLQLVVAQVKQASDADMEAFRALVAAVQRKLDNVQIEALIVTLDSEGKFVGESPL